MTRLAAFNSMINQNATNFDAEDDMVMNMDYDTPLQKNLNYIPFNDKFEIKPVNLTLLKVLGGGHFGDVHLGLLLANNGSLLLVAVKTPKLQSSDQMNLSNHNDLAEENNRQRDALRDELKIMSFLPAHPNVIKLLGAITTNRDDFCVVTEYCEYGGLDSFLRAKFEDKKFINDIFPEMESGTSMYPRSGEADLQYRRTWSADYYSKRDNGQITTSDLLWFALQITRAMKFLSQNMVLHRDVALRNVLLKIDFTIRVSDFGLSRRAGDDGSYLQNRNFVVPYRYISPEALRSGRFSQQSESWSLGVVFWELFTFAQHPPYADMDDCDAKTIYGVLGFLDSGKRLPIPDCAPRFIAAMMKQLWHEDPLLRPTFESCQEVLHQELLQCNPLLLQNEDVHFMEKYKLQDNFDDDDTDLTELDGLKRPLNKVLDTEPFSRKRNLTQVEQLYIQRNRQCRTITILSIVLLFLCVTSPVAVYLIMRPPDCEAEAALNGTTWEFGPVNIVTVHRKYIRAAEGQHARVDQSNSAGHWERFVLVEFPDGKYAFRSHHGTFLSADEDGNIYTHSSLRRREKFDIIESDGKFAIKTFHGKYMSAEEGEDALIKADKNMVDKWERFQFEGRLERHS